MATHLVPPPSIVRCAGHAASRIAGRPRRPRTGVNGRVATRKNCDRPPPSSNTRVSSMRSWPPTADLARRCPPRAIHRAIPRSAKLESVVGSLGPGCATTRRLHIYGEMSRARRVRNYRGANRLESFGTAATKSRSICLRLHSAPSGPRTAQALKAISEAHCLQRRQDDWAPSSFAFVQRAKIQLALAFTPRLDFNSCFYFFISIFGYLSTTV